MSAENIRLAFVISPLIYPDLYGRLMDMPSRMRGKFLLRIADQALGNGNASSASTRSSLTTSDRLLEPQQKTTQLQKPGATDFDESLVGARLDDGLADAIVNF